jgi:nucleoside-diphosphate-sugar epimerase
VVEPTTNYARQKLKAELELAQVFKESQEKLCVARVFSVLDWDVAPFTLGGAVSRLLDPDSDFVLKNGDDVRDFLTPKTIAATLESIAGIKSIFGTVNLCSGVGTKVSEAAKRMISTSGFETPTGRIEPGNSSAPIIVGVNSKLKSHFSDLHLHWEPSTHP